MDGRRRRGLRRSVKSVRLKLGFSQFVSFLLLLALLALVPILFFYSRLDQEKATAKECEWIQSPPLVCAHGGDTSKAPPNTLAAYKLALDAGVDCMEIDASRTQDGVLVALHDRELSKMANATFELHVGDFTFDQIQELDAGFGFQEEFRGQKVPSLDNALRYVSRLVKEVIVDVKVGPPSYAKNLAADVKSVVEKAHCKNCVVWSKVDDVVRSYKRLSLPNAMTGYIVMDSNKEMAQPLRLSSANVVGIFYGLVTERLVSKIHRAGKRVHAWTVNDEHEMVKVLHRRVDCVVTSQPRLFRNIMDQKKLQCSTHGFT